MSLFGPRYADGERLEIGGLPVRLSVSRRARRVSLRIDRLRREVIAVAPSVRRLVEAAAFARERRDWAARRLAELPAPGSVTWDRPLTLFGATLVLVPDGRRARLEPPAAAAPRRLLGCGLGAVDPQLVARAIKREAREAFARGAARHCASLGVATPPIRIGDAATRWGSCAPARAHRPATIRLSWRLALAPAEVADYVVAHECAHLIEANHGVRFWALVQQLVGDVRPHRAWLRANGSRLHAFGRAAL
jgi:hypothetical protein